MNAVAAFEWMMEHAKGGFTIIREPLAPGDAHIPGLGVSPDGVMIFRAHDPLEKALFGAAMQSGAFED